MLYKIFTVYVYLQTLFCGCGGDRRNSGFERPDFKYKLEKIARLNEQVQESSGLAHAPDSTFWTHGDSGTPATLYQVRADGELLQTLPLDLPNRDWEELAESGEQLFIGDFGNNQNNRQDLRIHILNKQSYTSSGTINFTFGDQMAFPPAQDEQHFDLEAFFYHQDSLYLFTKSRGRNKQLKLYTLPATAGRHVARLQEQLPVRAMTTAAALSPDEKQFAILGYGKVYLFEVQNGRISLGGKHYCVPVGRTGQAEAILYTSPNQLLITNESGKLFELRLRQSPSPKAK
ncbi:hypothetical protein [Pontibacter akesuensis]|uniref:WD40-like Beta Propeller Repeat n=1 Tax=Pontibacter akesuensis TaxID=388950 RepID=A0A1I7JE48_9BACT|nr:hypothetical protein [Pontibacter akesuensis]GHA70586.1 hypothetical protein GCM10007389_24970 [Pontibacter akesuensis]SFU83456.1 hypothetical protein SAMN04487941_2771 [Pontibacter akesuensis]